MQGAERIVKIDVVWRGRKFMVEMDEGAGVGDLGTELQKLTDVKAETMRLIVPQIADKSSRLVQPFSDEHSRMSLREIVISEGKAIRMMGVPEVEVDGLLEAAKTDLRIAGFDEEEKRLRLRAMNVLHGPIKLPQGPYFFCDFRTLQLPGIELNPPPSEALRRMHLLAADPGIVAIMNKYRWRVGLMSEMAPIGYVGISPKCLLGLNKNHGEEISLRLRTDDLKGFRKYETIKKTLLHELAHMVYSEHDANFYALDRQLNEEAISMDWTRSQGHTVNGLKHSDHLIDDHDIPVSSNVPHKLGGNKSEQLASAHASSVAAAYERFSIFSTRTNGAFEVHAGSKPLDSSGINMPKPNDARSVAGGIETIDSEMSNNHLTDAQKNHPDPSSIVQRYSEPDPDDCGGNEMLTNGNSAIRRLSIEPDPDDLARPQQPKCHDVTNPLKPQEAAQNELNLVDPEILTDRRPCLANNEQGNQEAGKSTMVFLYENFQAEGFASAEPDPDNCEPKTVDWMHLDEPDPDDVELKRIHDPAVDVSNRLQKAIKMLTFQVDHTEATKILETLVRIIRNVIEHPEETKFRRLRKANPTIRRNIANRTAALEILTLVGFHDDVVLDDFGKAEAYLVLKRNDPGLLWLAKASIETCLA